MKFQLIQGNFESKDALEILTKMVQVKIKFHEEKIDNSLQVEDIKMREKKIRKLQNDLSEVRSLLMKKGGTSSLSGEIEII